MKKDELLKLIERNYECLDEEASHRANDLLLLEFINDDDITRAFLETKRWYA